MKKIIFFPGIFGMFLIRISIAQTLIPLPDTLSGSMIELTVKDSVKQFIPGINTATIGYNGRYLGPTLMLHQGDSVRFLVHNELNDTTTVHWHGLHVSPMNDGGPHSLILPGQTWSPQFMVMDKAATYWYHPHPHGKTMEQVVKGAAGLIIVRDDEEAALPLPRTYGVDDIPLIFQFQTFDSVTRQIIANDETDNAVLVNGTLNGMVNAPAQVVRLRMLNASSMRFFRFGFADNRTFHQMGTDGGLLDAPVALTRLDLSPGERAEVLVDFTGEQDDTVFLKTFGSEFPAGYPGGPPIMMMPLGPLDNRNFTVLQINVTAPTATPVTAIPASLTTNTVWAQAGVSTRSFDFTAQPPMSSDFFINGVKFDMQVMNFSVQQESVEIWNLENLTFVAHPFHVHGNHFYILSKNGFPPPANERGRKDVVLVPAMSSVRIITKFSDFSDTMMPYMYHCHLLSHEDDGMMGQFTVSPLSPFSVSVSVTHVSCSGGADGAIDLNVSGGLPPYSFRWSNGDTTQNITMLTAGDYTVTVADSYNSVDSFSVSVDDAPELEIGVINGNDSPADSSIENYHVIDCSPCSYQWSVTSGEILSGQGTHEVQIQWLNAGGAEITVVAGNGQCFDTAQMHIIVSSVLAIEVVPLLLYPNPNNRNFFLQLKSSSIGQIQIEVLNIFGQHLQTDVFPETHEGIHLIRLTNAVPGIYFVRAKAGDIYSIQKITVF